MSKINQLRIRVRYGLYYLTEHAIEEAEVDGLDIYDIEHGILTGRIRRSWPKDGKYEVVGRSLDARTIACVCRLTGNGKVCVITAYEDHPTV